MRHLQLKILFTFLIGTVLLGGSACKKEESYNFDYTHDMTGIMWPFYKYAVDNVNDTIVHIDTVRFISATHYSWNGATGTYQMGGNSKYNTMYHHMQGTPFGTLHRKGWSVGPASVGWHVKFTGDDGHTYYFW